MHILLPVTDNCSSWISGRGRQAVEIFSWPSFHERMCRTWGSNLRTRFRSSYSTQLFSTVPVLSINGLTSHVVFDFSNSICKKYALIINGRENSHVYLYLIFNAFSLVQTKVCLFVLDKRRFQQFFSHITTVSGYDKELNAHFYSAASLKYHAQDTWHDTTPNHIILTLGWPVLG